MANPDFFVGNWTICSSDKPEDYPIGHVIKITLSASSPGSFKLSWETEDCTPIELDGVGFQDGKLADIVDDPKRQPPAELAITVEQTGPNEIRGTMAPPGSIQSFARLAGTWGAEKPGTGG